MKIYSNVLSANTIKITASQIPGLNVTLELIRNPKLRCNGWDVTTSSTTGTRWKNTGTRGASRTYAASRDDHGNWFALLYAFDPHAIIVGFSRYTNADDFHKQTNNKYKLPA